MPVKDKWPPGCRDSVQSLGRPDTLLAPSMCLWPSPPRSKFVPDSPPQGGASTLQALGPQTGARTGLVSLSLASHGFPASRTHPKRLWHKRIGPWVSLADLVVTPLSFAVLRQSVPGVLPTALSRALLEQSRPCPLPPRIACSAELELSDPSDFQGWGSLNCDPSGFQGPSTVLSHGRAQMRRHLSSAVSLSLGTGSHSLFLT